MHLATRSTCLLCVALVAACADDSTLPPTAPATGPPLGVSFAMAPDPTAHTDSSGGATTVFDNSDEAFEHPSPNLNRDELDLHGEGDDEFEAAFVPGVSRKKDVPGGLGPVFDNVSCEGCHAGDGRGRPPLAGEAFE